MKLNMALLFVFSTVIILLTSSITIYGQTIEWTKTYGGTDQDGGESMVLTNDGGIVITGFKSFGSVKDVLLMKTDASGNELWSRTYNLGINDWARSLRLTQDGGFIIAGMTEVSPQIFDPFLIKTDSEGNLQWINQYDYGFGDDDRAHAVWQTSDGGYIIAGQTWLMHGAFGNYDMYIIKTDVNGNVQWRKVYFRENEGGDVALGIQQLNDGGYIIGGFTQSSIWASYIIRTDDLGNIIWSNIYPGDWQSECYDIQATPDGGFILTGTETSFQTDADVMIIKLNAAGNLIWKKIYGTVEAEQGEFIQQLSDGYIIAGMAANETNGYDMYVIRTNSLGDSLWSKIIGGFGDDRAFSVVSPAPGSYLVTGWAWSYGLGLGDVYLVKLLETVVPVELTSFTAESDGADVILRWTTASELNNSGFDIQKKNGSSGWQSIGFIQGAGSSLQSHNYLFTDNTAAGKYLYRLKQIDIDGTFEYSHEIEASVSIPQEFTLEQNYPNPFNPGTTIQFTIPGNASNVKLAVYNELGEQITELVNTQLQPGYYKYSWDGSGLASGIYIYKLTSDKFSSAKKMILQK